MTEIEINFSPGEAGEERLDIVLLEEFKKRPELKHFTRSQIKNLIEAEKISVNEIPVKKAGTLIKSGARIRVLGLHTDRYKIESWDLPLDIVYEDEYLIVINKPPGVSMHQGAGEKKNTIVNALAGHFSKELLERDIRAGVVHRLDKDTTGLVVLAKKAEMHSAISRMFAERQVKKRYLALVLSTPRSRREINKADSGRIETFITRDPKNRTKMAVSESAGRRAITDWRVVERMSYGCLCEIDLLTGRTHQIRVHFDYIKSPVIGDPVYGDFSPLPPALRKKTLDFGRQALHAWKLSFEHPVTGKVLDLSRDQPKEMSELIDEFRKAG